MIHYSIFNTEEEALLVSRELYRLSIDGEIDTTPTTQYLFSVIKHPKEDLWAMMSDSETDIPMIVNKNPDPVPLATMFKAKGLLGEAETQEISKKAVPNTTVRFGDIVPMAVKQAYKNHEQMERDGWFQVIE